MYELPISVKGIIFDKKSVWLRKNERNEWELPGGKLEENEQLEETVVRELREELGFDVRILQITQAHRYDIQRPGLEPRSVLVISYLCELQKVMGGFEHIGEAGPAEFRAVPIEDVVGLPMPQFYKDAITNAWQIKQA